MPYNPTFEEALWSENEGQTLTRAAMHVADMAVDVIDLEESYLDVFDNGERLNRASKVVMDTNRTAFSRTVCGDMHYILMSVQREQTEQMKQ